MAVRPRMSFGAITWRCSLAIGCTCKPFKWPCANGIIILLDVLISLTQMMVEGELLQLERLHKIDISEADYMELVDRKTASLFSACARMGAIAAGASEAHENQLADFAWNLGMAFQLVDDILDFTSTEKVLGKPSGNDLREGKVTLPLIYALENASADERQTVETILTDGSYENVPFMQVVKMLRITTTPFNGLMNAPAPSLKKPTQLIATFPDSPAQRAFAILST